jgi:hypothetical protein
LQANGFDLKQVLRDGVGGVVALGHGAKLRNSGVSY